MHRVLLLGALLAGCPGGGEPRDTAIEPDTDVGTDPDADTDLPDETVCGADLPIPPAGSRCTVEGDPAAASLVLRGRILTPRDVLADGTVVVDAATGEIACVGCDCPVPDDAVVVSCPDAVVSPGLINAHDHLRYTLSPPVHPPGTERYDHRHDWRRGLRGHTRLGADASNTREAVLYGELRQLLSGTTAIAGSISSVDASGLLRNLDSEAYDEGLDVGAADTSTFPLGDADGTLSRSGCDDYRLPDRSRLDASTYVPHVAEGIDAEAHNEFACLSSDLGGGVDVVAANTALVHGIGLTPPDIGLMASDGAALVWSPRSNVHLYGMTAPVTVYAEMGVLVALGTDWTASGSAHLLRELQCADRLDREHFGDRFSDADLWRMATVNGAAAFGADHRIGVLSAGALADVAVYAGEGRGPHRAVLDAGLDDVVLVLRGGTPLVGDEALMAALLPDPAGCEVLPVCGVDKLACVARDTGLSIADLRAAAGPDAYPLVPCDPPPDEPSCTPLRNDEVDPETGPDGIVYPLADGEDLDGDGVLDADDLCPTVFDPPRPLDGGVQGDFDGDGVGDACDACPLNAGSVCAVVDPFDLDGDGVDDADDVCPAVADPGQEDADGDGLGAACDPCDDFANPRGACPATVWDVKTGGAAGAVVVPDLVVTAVGERGWFLQRDPALPGYRGVDHSAVFVYEPVFSPPRRGDRVTVEARVGVYNGEVQLQRVVALTVDATGIDLAPTVVAPADVAPGGPRADALQSALIRVEDVEVTAAPLPPGPGEAMPTNAFEVDGVLRVDDWLYTLDPLPQPGETFAALTGVLRGRGGDRRLEIRDALDVEAGPAAVAAVSPEALALPADAVHADAVEVLLTRPAPVPVEVALACTPAASLGCPETVTVPAGAPGAPIPVETGAPTTGFGAIVASVNGTSASASVRVYDDATPRAVAALEPDGLSLRTGGTGRLVVALDLPAPPGGAVVALAVRDGRVAVDGQVAVAEGETTAPVSVVAGPVPGEDRVSATLNGTVDARVVVRDVGNDPNLYFTRYLEGSGYDKAVQITNADGAPVDVGRCAIRLYANGASSPSRTIALGGPALAPGASVLVCHTGIAVVAPEACDVATGSLTHNGNDAIELVCDGTPLDVIGRIGEDPGSGGWGTTLRTTDHDLVRRCDVVEGDPDGTDPFDPADQWRAATADDVFGVTACARR